jgi:regulator of RNase E activity RraA
MASFGAPVEIGPLKIADRDIVMADEGGVIRIPRSAVPVILEGMAAFRELERSVAAVSRRPGLTAAGLRAWYAQNEPEFLGDEPDDDAGAGARR